MYQVIIAIQIIGLVVLGTETVYLFTRRSSRLQVLLLTMSICILVTFLGGTFEILSHSKEQALMAVQMSYLGKPFIIYVYLLFFLEYCRIRLPRGVINVLFLLQLAVAILAITSPYHTLFYTTIDWSEQGLYPHLVLGKSIPYIIYCGSVIIYLSVFVALLVRQFKHSDTVLEKKQSVSLLATVVCMLIAFLLCMTGVTGDYDTTLPGYVISIMILVQAIMRFNLFETMNLARDEAFEDSDSGIVVLDQRGEIIFANTMATNFIKSISDVDIVYEKPNRLFQRGRYDEKTCIAYTDEITQKIINELNTLAIQSEPACFDSQYYAVHCRDLFQNGISYGKIYELKNITVAYTYSSRLEYDVEKKTEEIHQIQRDITISFANIVEARDGTTGEHIKNTSNYVRILATGLQELLEDKAHSNKEKVREIFGPGYEEALETDFLETIVDVAPLHDIGKISIPDAILMKPGKLTHEEFETMKTHCEKGAEVIENTMRGIEADEYVEMAKQVALCHHEKWNGKGYPNGIAGTDIPLAARIMAVADVYDALCAERCYKEAFPPDKAAAIIIGDAGTHFDPLLVEVFKSSLEEIEAVSQ